ncbi:MAG: T9SS type A sorting domain-containing protein [Crocinitomicaceae bacterium]
MKKNIKILFTGMLLSSLHIANAQSLVASINQANSSNEKPLHLHENKAYGDILWSDDFSNPGNWIAGGPSTDYNTYGWSIGNQAHGWFFTGAGDMGTSGNFARFTNGDPFAPDIVEDGPFTLEYTGTIDLTGIVAPHVEFEHYGARYFTLQAVQVSTDGGTNWNEVINNNDIDPLTNGSGSIYPKPDTRSANISSQIAGDPSNVKIRLYWDGLFDGNAMSYLEYGWFVDNIRIVEGANYDIVNEQTYFRSGVGGTIPKGLEYYTVPLHQLTDLEFSSRIFNDGGSVHTNVHLETAVVKGSVVYSDLSANVDVDPVMTDSLVSSTTYLPADGTGNYTIEYNVLGDNTDEVLTGDFQTNMFTVSENSYSRSNGTEEAAIANTLANDGNPFQIGNVMEFFGTAFIDEVKVKLEDNTDNLSQWMYVSLYKYEFGAFYYVDQTQDLFIYPGINGTEVSLELIQPIEVNDGDVYLITAGHYGSTGISFGLSQKTETGTVLGYDGSFNEISFNNPRAVMLTLEMKDYYETNQDVTICSGDSYSIGASIYDTAGVFYDTLTAVQNGLDSIVTTNLTVDVLYQDTLDVAICDGQSYDVGSNSYTTAGFYTDTLTIAGGACDSIVHTNLSVDAEPLYVAYQSNDTVFALESGLTYQWVDCDNGNSPIVSETGQFFIPTINGNYAVIISSGGCSDTSACILVDNIGVQEFSSTNMTIYPNPASNLLTIDINKEVVNNMQINITDVMGKNILQLSNVKSNLIQVDVSNFASGMYNVVIYSNDTKKVVKLIIE